MANPRDFGVRYQFHPVGQGLFATGDLGPFHFGWTHYDEPAVFSWVFDCGTTSVQSLIDDALSRRRHDVSLDRLGLVVVSHFDKDHISGLVRLLAEYQVEVLLLPYVPLHQRLLIALTAGVAANSPALQFLADPIGFIQRSDIRGVKRIVVVPPSDGEAPPSEGDPDHDLLPENWQLEIDTGYSSGDGLSRSDPLASEEILAPGGSLRLARVWEFVPYNDATLAYAHDDAFIAVVHTLGLELLQATSDMDRQAALTALKAAYDDQFGSGSRPRNEISLFLYAGPIASRQSFEWRANCSGRSHRWVSPLDGAAGAVLYTGDAYLDTPERLQAMCDYLGSARIDEVSVLQVMHHGARGNWHAGVAAALDPLISVFSSDPYHASFGHPHAEVVRDFWGYGPVQVDDRYGAEVHIWPLSTYHARA